MVPGAKWNDADNALRDKVSQDRGVVCYPFLNDPRQLFLAVCDGHGDSGELVADFVIKSLLSRLSELLSGKAASANLTVPIKKAFVEANDSLKDSAIG